MTSRDFSYFLAMSAVLVGAAVDIALGLGVLVRRLARPALVGTIVVTLAYVLGATIFAPDLWLDPLGAMVKAIPAALPALVALALFEER